MESVEIKKILTRTTGFLKRVASHSMQPYRGCAFGRSLCGVGCYVRHNTWLTRGASWGDFLEARANAAEAYRRDFDKEQRWARRNRGRLVIFLSSSTEPFQPVEKQLGITGSLLQAMIDKPPDGLIIQTHTDAVTQYLELYQLLAVRTMLRFHISIESDLDRLPGLPAPACSVERRIKAATRLKRAGFRVVITLSPLLPIQEPHSFFRSLSDAAHAVVIDHYIGGDGSPDGSRTERTRLPHAMETVNPRSTSLSYRDEIVEIAKHYFPGSVGVHIDGFAGRMLARCRSETSQA